MTAKRTVDRAASATNTSERARNNVPLVGPSTREQAAARPAAASTCRVGKAQSRYRLKCEPRYMFGATSTNRAQTMPSQRRTGVRREGGAWRAETKMNTRASGAKWKE